MCWGWGVGSDKRKMSRRGKKGKSGQFWETVNLVPFEGCLKAWCSVSLGLENWLTFKCTLYLSRLLSMGRFGMGSANKDGATVAENLGSLLTSLVVFSRQSLLLIIASMLAPVSSNP